MGGVEIDALRSDGVNSAKRQVVIREEAGVNCNLCAVRRTQLDCHWSRRVRARTGGSRPPKILCYKISITYLSKCW